MGDWKAFTGSSCHTDLPANCADAHACIFTRLRLSRIVSISNQLCGSRHNMPRPSPIPVGAELPRAAEPTAPERNVAVWSHGEYVSTVTAAAA